MKTAGSQRENTVPVTAYVLCTAFLVGGMAGVAGFFGGFLIYPDCNLAPLLCVSVGGAGIMVGLTLGVALSAFRKTGHPLRNEFRWLAAVWALTLSVSIVLDCDLLFVSLQALSILLGFILLFSKRLRPNIPKGIRGSWRVVLVGALLILGSSLFPPATHPRWTPEERQLVVTELDPMPGFVFCADPRFDASRSYPELVVDNNRLLKRWLVIMIGTGLLAATALLHNRHKQRNRLEVGP